MAAVNSLELHRPQFIPQVAAIHDLCGYGNCSLGVVLPVLAAGGIEVCAVPTAFLSAHTAFPSYTFFDTSSALPAYFAHWESLALDLSGAYSGFLGSYEQISLIGQFFSKLKARLPESFIVVDPVMGDHGKIYKTYNAQMCQGMKLLAAQADLLTPNLTEAAVLLDRPYAGQELSVNQAEALCTDLLQLGAKNVMLKGIEREGKYIINALKGVEQPYYETKHSLRPEKLHGTGDLFASLVVAGYFSGHELAWAMANAGELTARAIDVSRQQPGYRERGVSYEPLLGEIALSFQAKGKEQKQSI